MYNPDEFFTSMAPLQFRNINFKKAFEPIVSMQTCNSLFDTLRSKSLHLAKNGQKTIPLMVLKPL